VKWAGLVVRGGTVSEGVKALSPTRDPKFVYTWAWSAVGGGGIAGRSGSHGVRPQRSGGSAVTSLAAKPRGSTCGRERTGICDTFPLLTIKGSPNKRRTSEQG
jgi:hypothetical protein